MDSGSAVKREMCHRTYSNGWGGGTGRGITTWCGYCKRQIPVDEEWVNAYYDVRERRARSKENGRRLVEWLKDIEQDRQYALRLVREENR